MAPRSLGWLSLSTTPDAQVMSTILWILAAVALVGTLGYMAVDRMLWQAQATTRH
ncbi:hypothetical protein [Nanchangia anserum]|uniref:hypothetical protein n=1 Tax=Nanchangia anserum TaxID=2692125 RepID=UPI001D12CDDC|nr:hypothetical protein [Nanchangia anserum]